MKTKSNKRRATTTLFAASLAMTACAGDDNKRVEAAPATKEVRTANAAETAAPPAQVEVEPGPVQQTDAPIAILTSLDGDVEVRRLGEETFGPAKKDFPLYLGDQVRAGDAARATILFPDESTAELAEVSTLALGSRVATADPASSAAVLGGVARFSVSPRAPGEGPFLVFTSAGVIATKGTVFGVGVAADGDARVGVESGAVEVAPAAALDAPVALEANGALELEAEGKVAAPAPWSKDDWGTWRDQAEANLDISATAALHTEAMAALASELDATYETIADLGTQVASFEAKAAAEANAHDSASYQADLPEAALAIDASFLAALRLEYLTHAYLSHAVLAADLYVRHPEVVAWSKVEPRVQAAVLWPKRFDLVAAAYLKPLRLQYYLHHPRGRLHAQWVGVTVPSFYASVTPPDVPTANVKAKLKFKVFTPPSPMFTASARPLWIAAPQANWHAKLKVKVAPPRGQVAFWVRPPNLQTKALLGVSVKGKIRPAFAVHPPQARGQLKGKWGLSLGHKIKVAPPDVHAAAQARAKWKADMKAPDMEAEAHGKLTGPELKAKGHGAAKAKLDIRAPGAPSVDAKAAGKGKAQAGASAKLKVKAPEVKAPKVKAEAKGSASFKLGR